MAWKISRDGIVLDNNLRPSVMTSLEETAVERHSLRYTVLSIKTLHCQTVKQIGTALHYMDRNACFMQTLAWNWAHSFHDAIFLVYGLAKEVCTYRQNCRKKRQPSVLSCKAQFLDVITKGRRASSGGMLYASVIKMQTAAQHCVQRNDESSAINSNLPGSPLLIL